MRKREQVRIDVEVLARGGAQSVDEIKRQVPAAEIELEDTPRGGARLERLRLSPNRGVLPLVLEHVVRVAVDLRRILPANNDLGPAPVAIHLGVARTVGMHGAVVIAVASRIVRSGGALGVLAAVLGAGSGIVGTAVELVVVVVLVFVHRAVGAQYRPPL